MKKAHLVAASVKANVVETIADLQSGSELISGKVRDRKLRIVGGVYNLADGKVVWL